MEKKIETMTEEQKRQLILETRRRLNREWRKKNPEKQKAYWEKYYLKKALEYAEQGEGAN